jgi:dihydrofolate reductase
MRKIISFFHASLDGFVATPKGEMDWLTYDQSLADDAGVFARSSDAALHGRTTYEMMRGYWPTVLEAENPEPGELRHAQWLENVQKVVVSTTMDEVDWNNTLLIKENLLEEFTKLKQQPGKNMIIFGSPGLTHSLARLGLIDQYRININPVAIGEGIPVFEAGYKTKLKRLESKAYENGVLGILYEVVK